MPPLFTLKTNTMNQAHLHLLLNHLPILGTLFGLLTLAAGFTLKNETIKRTALGFFVFSALCAIPAYLTGEGAEEVVENIPGASSETLVEAHEELANIFLWLTGALGVFSIFTFFVNYTQKKGGSLLYALTFVLGLGTMVLAKQVGTSGGEIRHTEIRSSQTNPNLDQTVNGNGAESEEDDE